ncbi:solute carrier family 35 member C2 isoform X1 [Dermatophagoides farinae]|uniref:solute carrier family 35 member C2 isoform X1 n=1 Tax=Dermatophagoides farinae TaxID=6954 RepID=UPI003F6112FA
MSHWERQFFIITRTIGLILIYYSFSIGITFYQKWFIKRFHYPLIIVVCHLIIKFLLASLFRLIYRQTTGITRITLHWKDNVRRISLPGIASALDIGFSNWSFEFITISLYTMTKSTCIIFILAFALLLDLEKKRLSLIVIVSLISIGLFMFTYKSTQFQLNGFLLVLSASMLSGLRWTLSQKLMQRKESCMSLSHPIDMMYHIQPWMIIGLLPLALIFELLPAIHYINHHHPVTLNKNDFPTLEMIPDFWHLIMIGSFLAFLMEFSEYLLLTYTSSLTLSMAGIFKEIFTLYLAVNFNGDQMSLTNFIGLIICLMGIIIHVMLKVMDSYSAIDSSLKNTLFINKDDKSIESKRLLGGSNGGGGDDNNSDIIHFDIVPKIACGGNKKNNNNNNDSSDNLIFGAKSI